MSRTIKFLRSGMYLAAMIGALGFGATQALGSPREAGTARACNDEQCNWECQQLGAGYGYCEWYGCECLL